MRVLIASVSPPSTPPRSMRLSKSSNSQNLISTISNRVSTSAKQMSTNNVKNPASRASKTNSLLLRVQRQTTSKTKSKISKLESTNSPVSALQARSTEKTSQQGVMNMTKKTTSRWWGGLSLFCRVDPEPGTGVKCFAMQLLPMDQQWLRTASVDPHYSRNSDRHLLDTHYHDDEETTI